MQTKKFVIYALTGKYVLVVTSLQDEFTPTLL